MWCYINVQSNFKMYRLYIKINLNIINISEYIDDISMIYYDITGLLIIY